ncbi:PspA/IM30 family protein [bacterium]|nr:PspA/IM30 family protein [bacterium]
MIYGGNAVMWQRFVRWMRSLFGGAIESLENPELILKQTIRDMRDQMPKINANLAKMRGGLNLMQKDYEDAIDNERKLTSRIKAALEAGDEELAGDYAIRLKQVQNSKEKTFEQLEKAKEAYEKAVEFKTDYKREMDKKINAAMQAIRDHQASKWKAEVASVFESFEVGDVDSNYDEMMEKLRQKTAMAEGKLDMAIETVDMREIQLEKRAERIEAQELLEQFKVEWGMESRDTQAASDKTVGLPETEQQ